MKITVCLPEKEVIRLNTFKREAIEPLKDKQLNFWTFLSYLFTTNFLLTIPSLYPIRSIYIPGLSF